MKEILKELKKRCKDDTNYEIFIEPNKASPIN
jgi:hypothetical protein